VSKTFYRWAPAPPVVILRYLWAALTLSVMADIPETRWVPANTFGQRLRQLRLALGRLSVEEAAALCGLNDKTWSTWENGRHPQRMHEVVNKIAEATNVDRDWLMYGDPPQVTRASFTERGKEAPIMLGMSPDARGLQLVAP
jgi:transcriptional regulator with XRE-family HTH domain